MSTFTLAEVAAFLDGTAPLDGVWFDEYHLTETGAYWWRKYLRAALSAAEARAWQPIETAPTFEKVLVMDIDGERYIAQKHAGAWYDASDGVKFYPTHWMPLPAAPTAAHPDEEGGGMGGRYAVHICHTSVGLEDLTKREQASDAAVVRMLADAGRFSVFEATDNTTIATTMDRIMGRYVRGTGGAFPWTTVELTDEGRALLAAHPDQERSDHGD